MGSTENISTSFDAVNDESQRSISDELSLKEVFEKLSQLTALNQENLKMHLSSQPPTLTTRNNSAKRGKTNSNTANNCANCPVTDQTVKGLLECVSSLIIKFTEIFPTIKELQQETITLNRTLEKIEKDNSDLRMKLKEQDVLINTLTSDNVNIQSDFINLERRINKGKFVLQGPIFNNTFQSNGINSVPKKFANVLNIEPNLFESVSCQLLNTK